MTREAFLERIRSKCVCAHSIGSHEASACLGGSAIEPCPCEGFRASETTPDPYRCTALVPSAGAGFRRCLRDENHPGDHEMGPTVAPASPPPETPGETRAHYWAEVVDACDRPRSDADVGRVVRDLVRQVREMAQPAAPPVGEPRVKDCPHCGGCGRAPDYDEEGGYHDCGRCDGTGYDNRVIDLPRAEAVACDLEAGIPRWTAQAATVRALIAEVRRLRASASEWEGHAWEHNADAIKERARAERAEARVAEYQREYVRLEAALREVLEVRLDVARRGLSVPSQLHFAIEDARTLVGVK